MTACRNLRFHAGALLLLLLLAAPPLAAQPATDTLLYSYVSLKAKRSWGAHLHCSAPGHMLLLRRVDHRIGRVRAALLARHGRVAIEAAEARATAEFEEAFAGVGAGVACRRSREMSRRYNADLQRDYDSALRPLEAALGLARH